MLAKALVALQLIKVNYLLLIQLIFGVFCVVTRRVKFISIYGKPVQELELGQLS